MAKPAAGGDPEHLRVARSQLDSVQEHCETVRETLTNLQAGIEGEDGAQALHRAMTDRPTLVERSRSIRENTFDSLHRQLSKLVAADPGSAADLTADRVEELVTELFEHHDRLIEAVDALSRIGGYGGFDRSAGERWDEQVAQASLDSDGVDEAAAAEAVEAALRATDHLDSTAELLRCLLAKSGPTTLPPAADTGSEYTVRGTVTQGGTPIGGVTVRAVDVDFRGEQRLGEATTDADGQYRIGYAEADFAADDRGSADVTVRVYNDVEQRLGGSETVFNAGREATVDVTVPDDRAVEPTEHARLRYEIRDLVDDGSVSGLADEDVDFLAGELALAERSVYPDGRGVLESLVEAATLAEETPFSEPVLYGLVRQRAEQITRDSLAEATAEDLAADVRAAEESGAVRVERKDLRAALAAGIEQLRLARDLEAMTEATATVRIEGDGDPLSGYRVRVGDTDDERKRQAFVTDADGEFPVAFMHDPDGDPTRTVDLTVFNGAGARVHEETTTLTGSETTVVTVADSAPGFSGSASLEQLQSDLGDSLADVPVSGATLSTVRRAGGLNGGTEEFGETARTLAAFDLTTDPATGSALAAEGFRDQFDVATTPARAFQSALRGTLPPADAARLHTKAKAQTRLTESLLVEQRTARRNGTAPPLSDGGETDVE
jgi:hypothetical protein